jgi:hypothetical protein
LVPSLNFGKLKTGKETIFSRNMSDEELQQPVSASHAEFCFEDEAMQVPRAAHPHAPAVDNRCYVYRAVAPDVSRGKGAAEREVHVMSGVIGA